MQLASAQSAQQEQLEGKGKKNKESKARRQKDREPSSSREKAQKRRENQVAEMAERKADPERVNLNEAVLPPEPEGAIMFLPELLQTLLTIVLVLPIALPGEAEGISVLQQPDWILQFFDSPEAIARTLVGVLVGWIGFGIQQRSARQLYDSEEGRNLQIVKQGLYGTIRHPIYFGYVFSYLGVCVVTLSPIRLLVVLLFAIALVIKADREEITLIRAFGPTQWEKYCKQVPKKFIPLLF
eukprot:TRINITY_DN59051_c0_g1_i2.p1 TRINITY_DN59051_c0_g1~~TRINITY_DN59051_c0_g1_i2.p1  ORF type:complete len:240 (-),score=41.57 TRINITY_DN59051_c0_g1_i2:10-729(-)